MDSFESSLVFFVFLILAVFICPILNSITHIDIYSSRVFDVDKMMDSIEMQNLSEKTKYIPPEEEPYDELEHATLFGTESWKLTHYMHKNNYDRFKKSNNSE